MLHKINKIIKKNKIPIFLIVFLLTVIGVILYLINLKSKNNNKEEGSFKNLESNNQLGNEFINRQLILNDVSKSIQNSSKNIKYPSKNIEYSSVNIENIDKYLQKVQDALNIEIPKAESQHIEFVNISGLESLLDIPIKKEKFTDLKLNIDDKMSPKMQLQRMKFVLLELKKNLEANKSDNIKTKEEFTNSAYTNQILNEIGDLLKDIGKNQQVESEITQKEHEHITVEEEVINREKEKDDSEENVFIHSSDQEGIDSIYHPRIHVI